MCHINRFSNRLHSARQVFAWLVILCLALSGCRANETAKVYHVGILSGLDAFSMGADGFKSKMTELGYVEGKNIVYDLQKTNVDINAYKSITQKFVKDKVDLIYVFPTEASMEANTAIQGTNVPMVFCLSFTDVPGIKLINSIREPGGNITGVRFPSMDIANKRLQILLEIVPQAKRIWVPYLQGYPNVPGQLDVIRQQAAGAGIEIIDFAAATPPDLQAELDRRAALPDIGIDAILLIAEPLGITPDFYSAIGKFSYDHKIPAGGALMTTGGYETLFGLLPDAKASGEKSALLADKVLKGTKAGTIPVVTDDNYLQVNYKASQTFNIVIPESLLKQADKIIR